MLFRETVTVYCENRAEETDLHKLRGRNFSIKADGTYISHCAVRAKKLRQSVEYIAIRPSVVRRDVMNVNRRL
jgi:hypothetical protein